MGVIVPQIAGYRTLNSYHRKMVLTIFVGMLVVLSYLYSLNLRGWQYDVFELSQALAWTVLAPNLLIFLALGNVKIPRSLVSIVATALFVVMPALGAVFHNVEFLRVASEVIVDNIPMIMTLLIAFRLFGFLLLWAAGVYSYCICDRCLAHAQRHARRDVANDDEQP